MIEMEELPLSQTSGKIFDPPIIYSVQELLRHLSAPVLRAAQTTLPMHFWPMVITPSHFP